MRARAGIILSLIAVGGPTAAESLDELLGALAARGAVVARFEEQRHLSFLERPLISWGTVSFSPPDELIKQTLAPEPSLARIEGDRIVIMDDAGERHLSLGADPMIRAYVAPFRAVLAGDRAALERHYEVEADVGPTSWSLLLRPRDPQVALRIERVEVTGSEDRVARIVLHERGGDRVSLQLDEPGS